MFKAERPKFYTSKIDYEKLDYYQNKDVIKLLTKEYPSFQMGYIPEYYDVAFIMIEESIEDSFQDIWKIVFFKKTLSSTGGTITLDNIDQLDTAKGSYEIYKTLDGSFENVINISCDLITKHKANIQDIDDGNQTSEEEKTL
jgi:hypothetical protein